MPRFSLLLLVAYLLVSLYCIEAVRYKPGYNFQLRRLPPIKKRFYDWGDAQPTQSPHKRFYSWADGQSVQPQISPNEREFLKDFLSRKGPEWLKNHKMFSQYQDTSMLIR